MKLKLGWGNLEIGSQTRPKFSETFRNLPCSCIVTNRFFEDQMITDFIGFWPGYQTSNPLSGCFCQALDSTALQVILNFSSLGQVVGLCSVSQRKNLREYNSVKVYEEYVLGRCWIVLGHNRMCKTTVNKIYLFKINTITLFSCSFDYKQCDGFSVCIYLNTKIQPSLMFPRTKIL